MSGIYITRGDIIQMDNPWLVLDIKGDFCLLILLETKRTKIKIASVAELHSFLDKREAKLIIPERNEQKILPFMERETSFLIHERNRRMAEEILHFDKDLFWLAERKRRAGFIEELAERYDVGTDTVRRFMRTYLQNNMSLHGLECRYYRCGGKGKHKQYVKGKRPGRKGLSGIIRDDIVISHFNTIIKRAIASKDRMSMTMMYQDLCREFYSSKQVVNGSVMHVPYAAVYRPTQKQFYYYYRTSLTDEEKYIARYGPQRARNNIRPLFSDTIADLDNKTIGDRYEVDEMEADFSILDYYGRNQVIGRPVVYFSVDSFSKMITGFSAGIDNNSWAGGEMLFLCMAEDKVEICRRAGIDISPDDWPVSGVLPATIQTDNGSEYLSKAMEKFAIETGTKVSYVPPGMGSYKPNVEQKFRQFNSKVKPRIPGEIVKGEYGQPHLRGARLTMKEFYQLVIEFILYYNKTPMTNYPMDAEMLEAGLVPSPLNIWKWKQEQENALRKIVNMNQFKYSLLIEGDAVITREGIKFKKILYTCEDIEWLGHQMVDAGLNGSKPLVIRYDVRNMDIIYFEANGTILKGWINDKKTRNGIYKNITEIEVDMINQYLSNLNNTIQEQRLMEGINFDDKVKNIVKFAEKEHSGTNSIKNIRDFRKEEKQRLHAEAQVVIETQGDKKPVSLVTEKPDLGKAPTLLKYESMDKDAITFTELLRIQEQIDYEVKVLGYRDK